MIDRALRWSPPQQIPSLSDGQVHVWRAFLRLPPSHIQELLLTLTPDERERAERYHFQRDRERFVAARGLLRAILGRYLGLAPSQLRFCYGPQGKPALSPEIDAQGLRFNVAHSDELALYAITHNRDVGVDLERVRSDLADEAIAKRFFSPREVAALTALPADLRQEAFFHCWTRKEAYLKARGDGLTLALDQFDVSLSPGEPAALISVRGSAQAAHLWSLQALYPEPGYVAAVAVEGHNWQLRCWEWVEHSDRAPGQRPRHETLRAAAAQAPTVSRR